MSKRRQKTVYSTAKTTNKLEKVGKRKGKNLQKLSPDGGETKVTGARIHAREKTDESPKPVINFYPTGQTNK